MYTFAAKNMCHTAALMAAMVAKAVQAETGLVPEASTSGGTSDARFVKDHCPVVEFGLVGKTMHQVDERVEVAHIHALKSIGSTTGTPMSPRSAR